MEKESVLKQRAVPVYDQKAVDEVAAKVLESLSGFLRRLEDPQCTGIPMEAVGTLIVNSFISGALAIDCYIVPGPYIYHCIDNDEMRQAVINKVLIEIEQHIALGDADESRPH